MNISINFHIKVFQFYNDFVEYLLRQFFLESNLLLDRYLDILLHLFFLFSIIISHLIKDYFHFLKYLWIS